MTGAFRNRRAMPQLIALALIACALIGRVLVPQGWMPVQTDQGWQISICSGSGPMTIDMPAVMAEALKGAHHDRGGQDHGPNDHPCAFSGMALALDTPLPPALALPALVVENRLPGLAPGVSIGRGLAAPPPPATGPPSLL